MKYTKQDLEECLRRLYSSTQIMLNGGIMLPVICEHAAIQLFMDSDNWSDTDIQEIKDRVLLRAAMKDLHKGKFNFA